MTRRPEPGIAAALKRIAKDTTKDDWKTFIEGNEMRKPIDLPDDHEKKARFLNIRDGLKDDGPSPALKVLYMAAGAGAILLAAVLFLEWWT